MKKNIYNQIGNKNTAVDFSAAYATLKLVAGFVVERFQEKTARAFA